VKRITQERESKNWTRAKLGAESDLHPAGVGQIESGRVIPEPVQLARLAKALGWEGDPAALLEEVQS